MKPGIKSTEYWVTVIAGTITLMNEAFGWEISADSQLIVGGIAAAYVLGRSIVKAAAAWFSPSESSEG